MTVLGDLITVHHRSVRAVNLDEDLRDPEVLASYTPGPHVTDALRRIVVSLQEGPRTRAWSITGPYGSGKSSFAHFLCSLLGPDGEPAQRAATELLRAADPQLADTIARERRRLRIDSRGAILAAVPAKREPIATALLRALHRGAELYWSGLGRKPGLLHRLRTAVREHEHSPEAALSMLEDLSTVAPVLVIVDELGKNLEYAADRTAESDLYLLQNLAERLSSRSNFIGGVLTLAHLAFEDYLPGAGEARRREWRKVHGRFDDVPFVANTAHSIRLLAEALSLDRASTHCVALAEACRAAEDGLRQASNHPALPGAIAEAAESTYPLHPSVALTLPALAARLGQHDRSLVSFLTSDAVHALPQFLARQRVDGSAVPFFRMAELYDYFFEDGAATALSGPEGELAREIRGRVEEARELEGLELNALKTVAVLNLVGGPAGLSANAGTVEEAMVGPAATAHERQGVRAILERLNERSIVTFRDFAGEYRIWQGSDFDVRGQIAAARERLGATRGSDQQVLGIIEQAHPLRPEVARRHSQQQHTLRYFECRYAAAAPDSAPRIAAQDADGLIVYVLAESSAPKSLPAQTFDGEPLVVVWSPHGADVREVAFDFAAANAVLSGAPELEGDPVARRELRHRVASLQAALAERVDAAFSLDRPDVWVFSGGSRKKARGRAAFSRRLSELCDERYPDTPVIRNEMVNRRELTSQGAKARRVLLERIFTHEHKPRLGLDGYGPERAMYEAVLSHTGLHRPRDSGRWAFGPPKRDSDVTKAWRHLERMFDEASERPVGIDVIYNELLAPPFGMKVGAVPLLLCAALQHRADDIFLYQEGSFRPLVEPALIERLVKTPERFAVKRASMIGVRASVFEQLRATVTGGSNAEALRLRNASTLAVVRPLVGFASKLPEYTRDTTQTSEMAQQVCAALLTAREPDELLFTTLPQACGLEAFSPTTPSGEDDSAAEYVSRLRAALGELGEAYQRLLERVGDLLHAGFAVQGPRSALREDLRTRSRRLLQQVIEPKMRSFLITAADEALDDDDWLEAIAMALANKPPSTWTDRDVGLAEALVAERSRWFRRLELLWHELHAASVGGFDARRVTITAPDGTERAELVAADAATSDLVDDVLADALAKLEGRIGARAEQALLGALAGRLLSTGVFTTKAGQPAERRASR